LSDHKGRSNKYIINAAGWTLLVVAIELISEFTGIRKYRLSPEPKTFQEVIHMWPVFVVSGIITFCVTYYWQRSKKTIK